MTEASSSGTWLQRWVYVQQGVTDAHKSPLLSTRASPWQPSQTFRECSGGEMNTEPYKFGVTVPRDLILLPLERGVCERPDRGVQSGRPLIENQ